MSDNSGCFAAREFILKANLRQCVRQANRAWVSQDADMEACQPIETLSFAKLSKATWSLMLLRSPYEKSVGNNQPVLVDVNVVYVSGHAPVVQRQEQVLEIRKSSTTRVRFKTVEL